MEVTAIGAHARETAEPEYSSESPRNYAPEVLIVDDHPMNRFVVSEMLDALGARSTAAADGLSAVRLAKAQRFDLVLMDLQMPGLDGFETTRLLRKALPRSTPTVIGLTASLNPSVNEDPRAAGLDGCLSKPLRRSDLAGILNGSPGGDPVSGITRRAPPANFDWQQSLSIAGGRAELARDLLVIMLETLAPSIDDILRAAREMNWPVLSASVHRLLGACRYTGAPRLTEICGDLEQACNRQDASALLEHLQFLEPAAEKFAIAAGDLLAAQDEPAPR